MSEALAIIREQVAIFAGVPVAALLKPSRGRRRVHWARQVGYWVSRETTHHGYRTIARAYCRSNHSTVISGIRTVRRFMAPELEALRDNCKAILEAKQ